MASPSRFVSLPSFGLVFVACGLLLFGACNTPSSDPCKEDKDCRGSLICVIGICVLRLPPETAKESATEVALEKEATPPEDGKIEEKKPEDGPTQETKAETKAEAKPEDGPTQEAKAEAKPEDGPTQEAKAEAKPEDGKAEEKKPEDGSSPEEKIAEAEPVQEAQKEQNHEGIATGGCISGQQRPCYTHSASAQEIGVCKRGVQQCVNDQWDPACQGEVKPSPELCDGQDNDCNGQIDDNAAQTGGDCTVAGAQGLCALGKLACKLGTLECLPSFSPSTESCNNGKDEDCDGQTDEGCPCQTGTTRTCYSGATGTSGVGNCRDGQQTCSAGAWSACIGEVIPNAEVCDNKDNDCDGKVDETFPEFGKSCTVAGEKGECAKSASTCVSGVLSCLRVNAPTDELCDNKDNDCDGRVDGFSRSCFTGAGGCTAGANGVYTCIGNCKAGTQTCSGGTWSVCAGQVFRTPEICDGQDNDCDGKVDESVSRLCYPSAVSGCQFTGTTWACTGTCATGQEVCMNGAWASCTGATTPVTDVCRNGKDEDCDGQLDEICGFPLTAFRLSSAATVLTSYGAALSPRKLTLGTATLGLKTCQRSPIFLTPASKDYHSISYICDGDDYRIFTSPPRSATGGLGDIALSGVVANLGANDTAAVNVQGRSCDPITKICPVSSSSGRLTRITKINTGTYEIDAGDCGLADHPIFATLYEGTPTGYIITSRSVGTSGKCGVVTLDLAGKVADRSFSFWIPDYKLYAWASIKEDGNLGVFNNFNDPHALWTSKIVSSPQIYEVNYPGWRSPSVTITSARPFRPCTPTCTDLAAGIGIPHNASLPAAVWVTDIITQTEKRIPFTILFAQ